jgi:hypothetical protein
VFGTAKIIAISRKETHMADEQLPEGTDTILTDADLAGLGDDLGVGGTPGPGKGSESSFATSGTAGGGSASVGSTPGIGRSDDSLDSTGAEADLITTGVDMSTETSGTGAGTSGALNSGSSGTGNSGSSSSSSGSSSTSGSGSSGGGVKQALRNSTDKLRSTAGDKALGLVGQGIDRSRDALTSISSIIGDTAANLDERLGSQYGDYARNAAQAIERAASGLADKDPEELVDDARTFVRKSPGVALAGAAILGFALVRVVKSGLEGGGSTLSGNNGRDGTDQAR